MKMGHFFELPLLLDIELSHNAKPNWMYVAFHNDDSNFQAIRDYLLYSAPDSVLSLANRQNWGIFGDGMAIEWADLHEHIELEGLLAGRKS